MFQTDTEDLARHLQQAESLHAAGALAEAAGLYRRILSQHPSLTFTAYNLGIILNELEQYPDAEQAFRQALQLQPDFLEAELNLCFSLQEQGRFHQALAGYQRLSAPPHSSRLARFNLACLELLNGELTAGWEGYELRFDTLQPVARRHGHLPCWDGIMKPGRRLLVHTEQGYGDAIQMARYLPLLAKTGLEIHLETSSPLASLLADLPGLKSCSVRGNPLPQVDFQVPIMSLPRLTATTLETIPAPLSYLTPAASRIRFWKNLLPPTDKLRIGLAWAGRLDLPVNRKRSISPQLLKPLLDIPDLQYISLQQCVPDGFGFDDPRMLCHSNRLHDFHDTAALIANLDLVITIDTSVAHLAGALGVPTWLLLPHVPDWRWLLGRDTSPWYPSMRLFRQPAPGDWTTVIRQVQLELPHLKSRQMSEYQEQQHSSLPGHLNCEPEQTIKELFQSGLTLLQAGRSGEAADTFRRLLALDPTLPEAWHNLGHACKNETPLEAEHALRTARRIAPHDDTISCSLAELYSDRERYSDALGLYREVLARHPNEPAALAGAGHACQNLYRPDEARRYYEMLLGEIPDDTDALNNLGVLYREVGDLTASHRCFENILARTPEEGDAHWNLSHTLLIAGELEQGWKEYEWRFHRTTQLPLPSLAIPRWQGESLQHKTILIWTEQAYGDTFQFIRYAVLLTGRGAQVIVAVQDQQSAALLCGCNGIAEVVLRDQPLPPADYWAPLLSLPSLLGTTLDTIPAPIPYLHAPAERLATWQQQINRPAHLKIGLVWAGRSRPDPRRSCPPEALLPLAASGGCSWYSLQVGAAEEDLAVLEAPLQLTDLAPLLTDFSETAAAICSLDLIITIDTSVAHLAGALGVPTWVMLPFAPDWRWLLNRSDNPWYPSMRLFRQPAPGDWESVIRQVTAALTACATNTSALAMETAPQSYLLDACKQAQHDERWQDALNSCLSLLASAPLHQLALLRAGGCLLFLRQPLAARRLFEQLIAHYPDHVDGHINRALACLTSGDYVTGWQEFEWRLRKIENPLPPRQQLPAPSIHIEELAGATLLVHTEQGFGDTLQFVRYLPALARLGIKLVVSVPAAMQRLLMNQEGIEVVIPHGEVLPATDYQTFLLSLPLLLAKTQPEPSHDIPYLHAPLELSQRWAERLPDNGSLRVGLAWSGRQMKKSGYRRSLSLHDLLPLLELPGVTFVSLQTGPQADAVNQLPDGLVLNCSNEIQDFADTAAIISRLDLVITIDTSVAHLAGALGKPTWVALLHAPDWRWGLEGETSVWYPGMRLFRQPEPGAWPEVIERMERELRTLLCDHLSQRAFERYQRHEFNAAQPLYAALLTLVPDNHDARFCLATSLLQCGQPEQAEALFRTVVAADPSVDAWNNLGFALGNQGRQEEAIDAFQQATLLEPTSAQSWQNLGNYLHAAGKGPQALQTLHQAAALQPQSPEIWQNLGLVHQGLSELDQAQDCFRRALALRPDYAMARWNQGLLLLLRDRYQEGFPLLEARFNKPGALAARHADIPRWQGVPIPGKRLLLHAEQGYGDTIQFLRYVPLLARQGMHPVVEVQDESLRALASSVEGLSQLFVRGEARPQVDLQLPLFSLAAVCGTSLDTIPPAPYLIPPPELVEQWRIRLSATVAPARRIGVAWRGRATPDPGRSVPIQELEPLFNLPNTSWYSLQVDQTAHQETPLEICQDYVPFLTDFAQTAACIANMDLVITIDTALAHLAGALGVPGIVMLQNVPDWRWGLEQENSPWYPTLHLVRQRKPGEWKKVIECVSVLLNQR